MRRCLHAFLVAVLTLSFSIDTAKACWYLRHGRVSAAPRRGCHPANVPACSPAPACRPAPVEPIVLRATACGCDGELTALPVGVVYEEIACGPAVACCGDAGGTVEEEVVLQRPATAAPAPATNRTGADQWKENLSPLASRPATPSDANMPPKARAVDIISKRRKNGEVAVVIDRSPQ